MDPAIQLAAQVIEKSQRGQPADAVLRESLRRQRGLPPFDAQEAARLVFRYFRWRGWLNSGETIERQLRESTELSRRFATDPSGFSDDELARAVPDWIWEAMEVRPDWLRSLQAEPRLWLRAKRGRADTVAHSLGDCHRPDDPVLADAVEYLGMDDLFHKEEFHAGLFEIQDLASQLVGLLCQPQPAETWWDACAGEGGKTLHLSDLMQNKGLIWASDRAEWRLQKLKLRAGRAKCFNYRARAWDGGAKPPVKTKFDGVLIDAPCSGVGTWARNPHARWTTTETDVRELAEVQKRLLAHAAPALKPGGRLIYSVCTLTRAETTGVSEWFAANVADFDPLPPGLPTRLIPEAAAALTLWPQKTGGNGMFVAAWRRRG